MLPLPGLDMMPLKYGLLRSYQTSLGVEIPLEQRFQFNVEGFFNYMDPTIFDLQINDARGRSPRANSDAPADVDRQSARSTRRCSSIG